MGLLTAKHTPAGVKHQSRSCLLWSFLLVRPLVGSPFLSWQSCSCGDIPARLDALYMSVLSAMRLWRQRLNPEPQTLNLRQPPSACLQTERSWASKIIRGKIEAEQLPGLDDYLAAVKQRREGAGRSPAATAG